MTAAKHKLEGGDQVLRQAKKPESFRANQLNQVDMWFSRKRDNLMSSDGNKHSLGNY